MKRRSGQNAPSYGEAQATAWLSWLARGMQQHGQTIFLIEGLQPSWLLTRTQLRAYILTTRLFWGIVVGLTVGLTGAFIEGLIGWPIWVLITGLPRGLTRGLIFSLILGLACGLIGGLIGGLIDMVRIKSEESRCEPSVASSHRQVIRSILLFALIGALAAGLIVGLILGPSRGMAYGLLGGVYGGLVAGPIWAIRSFGRPLQNEIRTIESIRFSTAYFSRGFRNGLTLGLIIIPIAVAIVGLGATSISGLIAGLIAGLIIWLLFGLFDGLLGCFRPGIRELKTVPNQGIWLSVRSAGLMGSVGGLGLGLIVGLLRGPVWGLVYGVLGGLCIGLWYGGLDVIQHGIVRLLLVLQGVMPWNYARFLDYAAEDLNFLQKVGGGYIFIHRHLLEYFAAMELPGQPAASDRHDVSQPAVHTVDSV